MTYGTTYIVRPFIEPSKSAAELRVRVLGGHPVVGRPGLVLRRRADERELLDARDVVRVAAVEVAAGELLLVERRRGCPSRPPPRSAGASPLPIRRTRRCDRAWSAGPSRRPNRGGAGSWSTAFQQHLSASASCSGSLVAPDKSVALAVTPFTSKCTYSLRPRPSFGTAWSASSGSGRPRGLGGAHWIDRASPGPSRGSSGWPRVERMAPAEASVGGPASGLPDQPRHRPREAAPWPLRARPA